MNKIIITIILIIGLNVFIPVKTFSSTHIENISTQSEAAILIEENSGEILYQKNSQKMMYPASLTKIATAIYAIEKGNLDDLTTVNRNATQAEGTRIYLEEGEKITLKKLIQGLLINSGNDAGVAIAEHLDGSIGIFSENINDYLFNEIGVKNTSFKNPHGLFNENHLTTAEDLAKITQYALKNKDFREIFGTKELEWKDQQWETTLFSHHKLMGERPYNGVTGGKTGFVDQSGHTLVTTAKRGDVNLIVVTLKGQSQIVAYNDTVALLDYGFDNFKTVSIAQGEEFTFNNIEYQMPSDSYFTVRKEEKPLQNITDKGTLEILSSNNEPITTFNLEKISKQKNQSNELELNKNKENSNSVAEQHLSILMPISIITFMIIISFFYREVRKI
ncbi:D-alanyl-D-alanine carboxypeptidase family protein [Metabacillus herbersteinensis]|uniref:D-alanyl-D-alanine carboxypeptidase family protein n=1 Tax=Metabacillus herbersteinensis TaxID=283816 RepID=A0ABV6GMC2_9BACI